MSSAKSFLIVIIAAIMLPASAMGMDINRLILYNDQALISYDKVIDGHLILDAPPEFMPDSLVVSPRPGASLRSISVEPERTQSGRVKELQENLIRKQSALAVMKKDQAMLEKQIDIIYDAAGSKGKAAAFEKARLSDALGFIENRVSGLNGRIVELGKKAEKLETEIKDLQSQLARVSQSPGYQIDITGSGPVEISYVVRSVSWRPEYRAYAQPGASKLLLESSVQARQSTGMDWDIKEMLVSTGRPGYGIEAPELQPWYVYRASKRTVRAKAEAYDMAPLAAEAPMEEAEMGSQATATSYLMGAARNIHLPGDGTPATVRLSKSSLIAEFSLVSVPKYSEAAFLRTESKLEGETPLVPGPYSSFVDGVFSGRGEMKRVEPGQKLTLDLGMDEGIKIERKETQAFHDKTLTGKDRITYTYEVTIENTRRQKASITLKDQIPVSRDDSITVELLKTEPSVKPDLEGILTWKIDLDPLQKKKAVFSFSITGDVAMVR